ncbi:MAG: DUF488 family protein [Acidobacteriota bacterium]
MTFKVALKRVYDDPSSEDGTRVLVERLWPRGVSKDRARVDIWSKETAPSKELRHCTRRNVGMSFALGIAASWTTRPRRLPDLVREGPVTFVFASKEERFNNAAALRELLLERLEE